MPMGNNKGSEDYRTKLRGANVIVIDSNFTVGQEQFFKEVSGFADKIRASKAKDGHKITLPGDKSATANQKALKDGTIDVNMETWTKIKQA